VIIVGVVRTQSKLSKGEQLRRAPGLFNGSIHEPLLTISAVAKERKKEKKRIQVHKKRKRKEKYLLQRQAQHQPLFLLLFLDDS
jgi:hypothetical protein